MSTRLQVVGFVSERSAHGHLLKHVLRVVEQKDTLRADDPEHWVDLIPDPPLPADVLARRRAVVALLEPIARCAVRGVTSERVCQSCAHEGAIRTADTALAPQMHPYLEVARRALRWAFENQSRTGPRALAFREGSTTLVTVITDKGVKLVAELAEATGELRARTCFRIRNRTFKDNTLELARERAGHRAAGTLVDLASHGV